MATIRPGSTTALLVIDVQVGVMRGAWDAARVVANVRRAVEAARVAGVPVIWVQHADGDLAPGADDWGYVPELAREAGETLVPKRDGFAVDAQAIVCELNSTLQWLEYPGLRNAVRPVADLFRRG